MQKKEKKGIVKRVIVTPDKHFPLHDKGSISVLCQVIKRVKPDAYIDLGDVGEWGSVSHWQWKKRKRPPLEYQLPSINKEIEEVNKFMDVIDEALDKANCTEKYQIEGNHDDWLNSFVLENPYLSEYKFKKAVKLDERGYKFYPLGKYLRIGKLWFYHGHHFGGIHHTRSHLLRLGCNIVYGHWHDLQQTSITHMDGQKSAWSIGCLKDMSTEANNFLGNRKHNWIQSFAIVDYFDNGYFTVQILQIINGKTSFEGKLITA